MLLPFIILNDFTSVIIMFRLKQQKNNNQLLIARYVRMWKPTSSIVLRKEDNKWGKKKKWTKNERKEKKTKNRCGWQNRMCNAINVCEMTKTATMSAKSANELTSLNWITLCAQKHTNNNNTTTLRLHVYCVYAHIFTFRVFMKINRRQNIKLRIKLNWWKASQL